MIWSTGNPNSPMEFFTNSRLAATPLGPNRVGSSSRRLVSGVDFDRVPSPRLQSGASKRRSMANGSTPGPSKLSKSVVAESPENGPEDDSGIGGGFDDYGPQELTPTRESSPQQTSFMQMNRDDDDDDDEGGRGYEDDEPDMEETPIPMSKQSKGKGRAEMLPANRHADTDVEDEIARGLEDVELQTYSDERESEPPTKKSRTAHQSKRGRERARKMDQRSCWFRNLFLM
jgi:centromere protein C